MLSCAELAAFALQGAWLSEANLAESTRIWFARNHLTTGWLDRVTLARRAHAIAQDVVLLDIVQLTTIIPARRFTDAMTVNYADALVTKIWHRCPDCPQHREEWRRS
ncbi:hypothetical protein LMG28614_04155 [Paraburkholderia ultramafica]|uniref:Uncharacterized protein n=1 Tax=Paraburkholderia ultramafica TaxID=1544867 RepID=A0A6S7BV13_9BURK|nr:hypothetical protein [Paraburkholderia ultramafica]CAB3795340.1 hypothetical protein LMG28614_04155 [Paraburkholderia ultramafica]